MHRPLALVFTLLFAATAFAQDAPATKPATRPVASSRITAVTVYRNTALVTREVAVPAGRGAVELVVAPLPASVVPNSLYAEAGDGLRALTVRYRTRATKENVDEEIRALDQKVTEAQEAIEQLQRETQTVQQNLQLLDKLEQFSASALSQMNEKGMLNADAVTGLSDYIMAKRGALAARSVAIGQEVRANQEAAQYLQRQRAEVAGSSDRTVREATVVVDRGGAMGAADGTVRLNYLVNAAGWRPQYKLRADGEGKAVRVEYLAAVSQGTGEDWADVELALSTARPLLNAAPPELNALAVVVGGAGEMNTPQQAQAGPNFNLEQAGKLKQEAKQLRDAADTAYGQRQDVARGNRAYNEAAAAEQTSEYLFADAKDEADRGKGRSGASAFGGGAGGAGGSGASDDAGPAVTFRLPSRLTVPWRDEEQLLEVARLGMTPDWSYKAVPLLTPNVYRLATLTNPKAAGGASRPATGSATNAASAAGGVVLLPGEAAMYLGDDFVGRTNLPLVAVGETFTVGFGVDPQLRAARQLVDKTSAVQGGNQVRKFEYRLVIESYKAEAAAVQLWDRLPVAEDADAVNVRLTSPGRELSTDPAYVRLDRPQNLLRWDLSVPAGANGEKAETVTYQFEMAYDRNRTIGGFQSK